MAVKFLLSSFLIVMLSACTSHVTSPSPKPVEAITPKAAHQVALLLPQTGDLQNAGKAVQAGFMDAYQSIQNKPTVKIYDESQYDQAVKDGADYIIGPLAKDKVAVLENRSNMPVVTIALNNPDAPKLIPNLYEFSLSPTDEVQQIADKAAQDGHHSALMIIPQGAWGQNIANALQNRFQDNSGEIVGSIAVNNLKTLDTQIQQLLEIQNNTRRQDFDVIFMIVSPQFAREIKPLLKYYQADNIPVYSTSLIYSGLLNSAKDNDLDGVEFCDMPLVLAPTGAWAQTRQQMTLSQPIAVQQYIRLYGLGWDAALLTQHPDEWHQGINGATGNLSVDANSDILRKLQFAIFENGIPQPIS